MHQNRLIIINNLTVAQMDWRSRLDFLSNSLCHRPGYTKLKQKTLREIEKLFLCPMQCGHCRAWPKGWRKCTVCRETDCRWQIVYCHTGLLSACFCFHGHYVSEEEAIHLPGHDWQDRKVELSMLAKIIHNSNQDRINRRASCQQTMEIMCSCPSQEHCGVITHVGTGQVTALGKHTGMRFTYPYRYTMTYLRHEIPCFHNLTCYDVNI